VQRWRDAGHPAAEPYSFKHFADVLAVQADEGEGFVVKFDNGLRVKVKFAEYLRLHKILTNITARTIWEHLRDHKQLQEIIDFVPDEFYKWVTKVQDDLMDQFQAIEEEAKNNLLYCSSRGWIPDNRKMVATSYKPGPIRGIMFQMIDGKDYENTIWKMIKPRASRPFIQEDTADETTCSDEHTA